MNQIDCLTACPIDMMGDAPANSMAFDGCYYYFTTVCHKAILKYDVSLQAICCYKTERIYACICYDPKHNCFWATSKCACGKIFQLNCNMVEIDCLCFDGDLYGNISALGYDCYRNILYAGLGNNVFKITACGQAFEKVLSVPCGLVTSITPVCHSLFVSYLKKTQKVNVYNDCYELCETCDAPNDFLIKSIVFVSCTHKCDCFELILHAFAVKKGCYPYLLCQKLCGKLSEGSIDCCDITCHCCEDCHCPDCCACEDCPSPCPKPCDHTGDIIESIALIETALSHILNAEGEKLQKVLATTDDIDEIMCVNREINQTIINVTHLEHVLYNKLNAATEGCPPCDTPLPPCKK